MTEAFRAVEWMRERRTKIDEEDRDLTWEQKGERTEEALRADPIWRRLKGRVARSAETGARPVSEA